MTLLLSFVLLLSLAPFLLALDNLRRYRVPALSQRLAQVSVLIPARNEAVNIADATACILSSQGVELELVVLDDGSTDGTAEILGNISDTRLRVISGMPLPPGWSGKQHACAALAAKASFEMMVFVDADVRLAPDALNRMAGFMERNDVALASGFPRQVTGSWAERLLLPLIHFLLFSYLPMARMQHSRASALGAGCGQLLIVRRAAYRQAGGHTAIRASLHDGITLPRAFRKAGFMTGLFDAAPFSTCRMYADAAQVWEGLMKNATEGMAKPLALPVWTIVLAGGQIAPTLLLAFAPSASAALAFACGIGLRLILAARFSQPLSSAALHPVGILALLGLQWSALLRAASGGKATWRGRTYTAQT